MPDLTAVERGERKERCAHYQADQHGDADVPSVRPPAVWEPQPHKSGRTGHQHRDQSGLGTLLMRLDASLIEPRLVLHLLFGRLAGEVDGNCRCREQHRQQQTDLRDVA